MKNSIKISVGMPMLKYKLRVIITLWNGQNMLAKVTVHGECSKTISAMITIGPKTRLEPFIASLSEGMKITKITVAGTRNTPFSLMGTGKLKTFCFDTKKESNDQKDFRDVTAEWFWEKKYTKTFTARSPFTISGLGVRM